MDRGKMSERFRASTSSLLHEFRETVGRFADCETKNEGVLGSVLLTHKDRRQSLIRKMVSKYESREKVFLENLYGSEARRQGYETGRLSSGRTINLTKRNEILSLLLALAGSPIHLMHDQETPLSFLSSPVSPLDRDIDFTADSGWLPSVDLLEKLESVPGGRAALGYDNDNSPSSESGFKPPSVSGSAVPSLGGLGTSQHEWPASVEELAIDGNATLLGALPRGRLLSAQAQSSLRVNLVLPNLESHDDNAFLQGLKHIDQAYQTQSSQLEHYISGFSLQRTPSTSGTTFGFSNSVPMNAVVPYRTPPSSAYPQHHLARRPTRNNAQDLGVTFVSNASADAFDTVHNQLFDRLPLQAPCYVVDEDELMETAMHALKGVPVAILCLSPRVLKRDPCRLKSTGTASVISCLATFSLAGSCRYRLLRFAARFSAPKGVKDLRGPGSAHNKSSSHTGGDVDSHGGFVLQAFAVALQEVLRAQAAALEMLPTSVQVRCAHENSNSNSNSSAPAATSSSTPTSSSPSPLRDDGPKLSSNSDLQTSLLELKVHTERMRTQLQALAIMCRCEPVAAGHYDLNVPSRWEEDGFPRGHELLSELYSELQDADGVMVPLLRFLFAAALRPYWAQVRCWLYIGKVHDPYGELHLVGTSALFTYYRPFLPPP
jgi:hypothetical protein